MMNFFKKRKAVKEQSRANNVVPEPISLDGSQHGSQLNGANGNEISDDPDLLALRRFDLSFPSEKLCKFPPCSRLAKSLEETLKDDTALGHYLRFMDSQGAGHLVRFWLEADSFRVTARSRLCSELNNAQLKGAKLSSPNDSTFCRENKDNASIEAAIALSKAHALDTPNGDCLSQTSQTRRELTLHPGEEQLTNSQSRCSRPAASTTKPTSAIKQIERDAVVIYQKYICPNVANRIELTEEAYHTIVSRICCEDGRVDPLCFVDAQGVVFEEMRRRFPAFRESEYHLKFQIDLLTSAKLTLSDILYHENALVHFMEFVEVEGGLPLIQFWLLVENFSKLLRIPVEKNDAESTSSSQKDDNDEPTEEDVLAQNDAMIIYDKYFSLQATEALGFGDDVRFQVEANICTEDGKVDADCFDTPVDLVLNLIAREYLPTFLQSPIYYRMLSDLINSRRLGGVPSGVGHRPRSGSDASSEASVGSSLQATSTTKKTPTKKRESKSVQDMLGESRIDIDADPDRLWRRKHNAGPLIFGKIDPMGDYRSELGYHPDTLKKKGSGRITKALRSLVQDEAEVRAREEMAAQIAQMMINDVTSMTLGRPAFAADPDVASEAAEAELDDT